MSCFPSMMAPPASRRLFDVPSTDRMMLPNRSGTGVHYIPRSSKHRMPRTPLAVSREETYQEEVRPSKPLRRLTFFAIAVLHLYVLCRTISRGSAKRKTGR